MHLGLPSVDQIDQFSEIKASRDVLEHSQGIVNELFRRRAGALARYNVGEELEIPEHYHRESWTLLRDVVRELTAAASRSAGPRV